MKKFISMCAVLAGLCSFASAQELDNWQRMQVVPTPQFAEIWHKALEGRLCVVSKSVQGEIRAVLLRGSVIKKDLDGVWHSMEWSAPSYEAAQARHLRLIAMHGNMIVGMEVADRNYYHNECGNLPPL